MTFGSRIKLLGGIIAVGLAAFGLFVYLNHSLARVGSQSAMLQSDSYSVGVDFGGTIIKQYVSDGSVVSKGDKLFEVRSDSYGEAIAEGRNPSLTNVEVIDSNTLVLLASSDGIIRNLRESEGSFIPDGGEVAVVQKTDSLYLVANYRLTPSDYSRVQKGNVIDVTMPDNQKTSATVYDITLRNDDGVVETVVKARFNNLPNRDYTFAVDTPVSTSLHLTGDTIYDTIMRFASERL